MKKELTVLECLNLNGWYNQIRGEKKLNNLSVGALWALRKNMKKIAEIADDFNKFRDGLEQELKDSYFNEEKSEDGTIKNEQGEDVNVRKVKDEYLEEYQATLADINNKIDNLVTTKEELELSPIDIDKEIERIGSEYTLSMDDLDILSIFEDTK